MEDAFYGGDRFEAIDQIRRACAMVKSKIPRGICALADTRKKSMYGRSIEVPNIFKNWREIRELAQISCHIMHQRCH